jgi:processive 1,2-diacylglycerol beta-glucosyltransferase
MKILILSCNTGGGHNTAAKSIKEVFDRQGDFCIIKDALAFGSQIASDLVCDSYVEIVKNHPNLFGNFYELGKRTGQYNAAEKNIRSPIYIINTFYAKSLEKYITEEKFDAIICTHFFPAEALTHLKKHERLNIPFYFVATDYSCSPMLEETMPSKIFVPHEDCLNFFIERGIPEDKLIVTGIPVGQNFTVEKDKKEARTELGLPLDKKILLIMTGSMGFGDTEEMTKDILAKADKNTCIVVVTGSNKELYEDITENLGSDSRLIVLGFTDKIYLYMSASDIFLSKPGGLSSTEALVKCIPIVHTAPIPGCESENVEFFTKHHLSLCAENTKDAAVQAIRLLKDDFLRNQIREAQRHYKYENSAMEIVRYVKKLS